MTSRLKSEANGKLPRAWQFLQRPWPEKRRSLYLRWTRLFGSIPMPIRLPFGAWWLARNDALTEILLRDGFENAERCFVERFLQPGMTVLDIGAHHGFYTLLASKRLGPLGKVISFEPSPRERKRLRLHILLNRCKNVTLETYALGDQEGESELYVVEDWASGCNSLRPPDVSARTTRFSVRVVRLDNWLANHKIDRVDFIKLDAEGGELAVLQGASHLLEQRPRPVILVEVQDVRTQAWGYRAKQIIDHLARMEYRWFGLSEDGFAEELDLSPNDFEGNFMACPKESINALQALAYR
jgi:FkbM family methyltransferase